MLVHQLISKGQPDTIALKFKDRKITYKQLQERVERFRDYFYVQGIRAGEHVGLLCKNSPEFIYSYLAICSLGAVVVPLNPMLTIPEIAYIVKDAEIKCLISTRLIELAQPIKLLILSEFVPLVDDLVLESAPILKDFDSDRECVIIYTSGTTGHAKGAVLTHNNLISNAEGISKVCLITEADNMLCVLPMFHGFAWTVAVLGPLINGACVTIMSTFLPKEALHIIREQEVTVVTGVPAMYNFYASLGNAEAFASVRLFVSGGASLPVEIMNQFRTKIGKPIMEGYGLSEASPVVTMNPLNHGKIGSIGLPLAGIETKIVDAEGNAVKDGEVGELITRGPNVMREYFNLPEETKKAIVDGWLHTADLAYADEEGYIYIIDRLKDLIIVGGLNVYPREIEEVIYKYPNILEATVIGVPDKVRGEAVCAFIVLKDDSDYDKKALMAFLQANLANYKLPREIILLKELPKNATGKISKKELRAQYIQK